ncbi:MAG: sensor histidine kinase [Thermoplasmatota archaeon]
MPEERFRILLVDDSAWDATAAKSALAGSVDAKFDVDHFETLAGASDALARESYDAVLLDLNLPDSATADALTRALATTPTTTPIVVLSGSSDPASGIRLLRQGAADFVSKNNLEHEDLGHLVRNVVKRYRAEREVRVLTRELTAVLDAVPDLLVVSDLQLRYVRWNPQYERVLGYTAAELTGRSLLDDVAPEERDQLGADLASAAASGAASLVNMRTKDGRTLPYYWTGSPLHDANGNVVGVVGIGKDFGPIAAARAKETALASANAERERLEAVSKMREQFFAIMAHEINNPLTIIVLQIDLIKGEVFGPLNAAQMSGLTRLENAANRLRGLAGDMLDVSKIQSGKFNLRIEPTDARRVVESAVDEYRILAEKSGITLEAIPGPAVPLQADRRRIVQVLVNYLSNAIKFTPPGGRITVETASEGADVVLRVRDTGKGLTHGQMDALFSPFKQANEEDSVKGTGLGLFISRGIATAHGGTVGCESDGAGKGSTFWLRVPARALLPDAPVSRDSVTSRAFG